MKKFTAIAVSTLATALTATLIRRFAPVPPRVRRGMVAIVTGGSRGLGLAIAHELARAGCRLVLASRNADELEVARDGILRAGLTANEDDILLVEADLADPEQCAGLIASALNTFGQLDILVNNAGIIEVGPVEDQPLAAYERAMQINFFAALYTSQAAMPYMLERRAGAIVNIASIGGKLAVPHMLPYSAAKFALVGYSEGLHAELRAKGVRVTTVCPGLIRSGGETHAKFLGNVEKEKEWFMFSAKTPGVAVSVEHAARAVFSALNRGRAEITISPQAWLAARFTGLAPETSQFFAALANQYILPQPLAAPADIHSHTHEGEGAGLQEPVIDPSPS